MNKRELKAYYVGRTLEKDGKRLFKVESVTKIPHTSDYTLSGEGSHVTKGKVFWQALAERGMIKVNKLNGTTYEPNGDYKTT